MTENEINDDREQTALPKDNFFWTVMGFVIKIGWITLFIVLMLCFVVGIRTNSGINMSPKFQDRDILVYYRLTQKFTADDVVVFVNDKNYSIVGRVVAVEGDTVDITADGLKINGYYHNDNYAVGDTLPFKNGITFPVTLQKDEYFILFDDRSKSGDSRTVGVVAKKNIKGKVILSLRYRDF